MIAAAAFAIEAPAEVGAERTPAERYSAAAEIVSRDAWPELPAKHGRVTEFVGSPVEVAPAC